MSKRAGSWLFFVYAASIFGLFHYNTYIYFTQMRMYSMTFMVSSFVFAVILAYIGFRRPNFIYALSMPFIVPAFYLFYIKPLDMRYFVFYGILLFIMFCGYAFDKSFLRAGDGYRADERKNAVWTAVYLLISFAGMAGAIAYINHIDKEILWFVPFRLDKYPGNMSGYDGVITFQFKEYSGLIASLLFSAAVIAAAVMALKDRVKNMAVLILIAFFVSFGGKLVFTLMTTQGISVIGAKNAGPLLSAYYHWAAQITDFQEFISNYAVKYQTFHGASHLKGHPPMPVVFFWIIIKYIAKSPQVAGLIYSFITSLAVVPFFYLVKEMTKNTKAGFVAALLYSVTPNNLILSVAGTDGMIAFLLLCFTALAFIGAARQNVFFMLASGVFFGLGTYFSFGIWHLLMFVFLALLPWEKFAINREFTSEILKWMRNVIAALAGIIALHLIVWIIFKGKFDYIQSFNTAKDVSVGVMLKRPFEVWSWINFFHWSFYASVPVMALFFARYLFQGYTGNLADRFSIAALAVVVMQFLAALGRAETHRMYMYLIVFVIPVAVIALLRKKEDGETDVSRFAIPVVALSLVLMIFMQIFVGDML